MLNATFSLLLTSRDPHIARSILPTKQNKRQFFCERKRHRSSDGLDTSLQTSANNDKYSRFFSFIHFACGKPLLRSWTGRREQWNINRRRFWFSQYVCYLRVLSMWYIPLCFLHLLLRVLLSTR